MAQRRVMMSVRLSVSHRLNLLLGIAVGAALILTFVLLSALSALNAHHRAVLNGPIREQGLAREMQVVFKKQVQEWKNILLRGAVPSDRARYIAAFREDRALVLALLMETMAAGAEENAATAQQLSASNQEQAAALQSMALSSGDLRDIAQRLDDSVALFKLDDAHARGRFAAPAGAGARHHS